MNKLNLVRGLILAAGLLAGVGTLTASEEVEAADGCASGYTRRASKVLGATSYAQTCKISQCVPIGRYSSFTRPCGILCMPDFSYQSVAGTAPTVSCIANVSDGPWN